MSLLDALLLDPVRVNFWIADRTDDVGGSGTQTDPFDGSTLAKFDAVMYTLSQMGEPVCVHLGPGEFQTAGYYDGIGGTHWEAKPGMRIVGSGIDVTTIKLVSAANTQRSYAIGHALSASTVDFFEVCDLTIDCNFVLNQGTSWTAGAVRIMGNHSRVARVKVKKWGNKNTGTPGFVIAILTGNPSVGVNGVTNCGIVDCIAVEPHASALGPMTVLHVGGVESADSSTTQANGIGPYIRNCFVDCGQTDSFTKDFRALSMAWCKGGEVEGNQIHNVKHGGPHQETGASDLVVRNNLYRNICRGPFWNTGPSLNGVKNLLVEGNMIELATAASASEYAISLETVAGPVGAHGDILIRNNRIRYVDGQEGEASGIRVSCAQNLLIRENVLELSPELDYPIANDNCGSVAYFENRKADGTLLRGYDEDTGIFYSELETDAEDAMILGFMKRR